MDNQRSSITELSFDEAISAISGDNFGQMKASADQRIPDGGMLFAEIVPSIHREFFYVSLLSPSESIVDYTKRPVRADGVPYYLSPPHARFDLSSSTWTLTACSPAAKSLYDVSPSKRDKTDNSKVYFIQSVMGGPIKIGRSDYPHARLESIQRMSPFRLVILATQEGGAERETELHKRFARLRLHDEWFDPDPELLRYIEEIRTDD